MTDWRLAGERALRGLWGAGVSCTIVDTLRDSGRNRAYRLAVSGGAVASVILKACVGDLANPYVAGRDETDQPFHRFCNEWVGCAMLGPLGLGPKALAGDTSAGFFLMEDLGEGETSAHRLCARDGERANEALLAYARSVGAMHAATLGQEQHWDALRRERGGSGRFQPDDRRANPRGFAALCARYGIETRSGLEAELDKIDAALAAPGRYLVFSPTDCCPDNHFLRGESVIFFDCERATMRHALLDAAYFFAPFPTCWCVNRTPDGAPERMLAAYRERFPGGDDFDEQLTYALAAWTLETMLWNREWETKDVQWRISTVRQRHLLRLENLLARPDLTALLPALADATQCLRGEFSRRWTDTMPMPLYPAFRNDAG